ncbi:MAG: site-2 protease family protein [Anaerolineales bacterium]|jgi:Zn-dependent protease
MRSGFRLGKIFGISIDVDWSLLVIVFLITWSLSSAFGQVHSDWSEGLIWSTAFVGAVLFLASILAHELAHSLVARTQGVPVKSITLFLFGGVSNIQRDPPSPRAEFLITIVGPVTSILLGVVFFVLSGVRSAIGSVALGNPSSFISSLDPLSTLLLWLGPVNIALGIFNLVPGFPLDGGRVLRSILWAGTSSLRKSTRWASWVGQAVAWLMIILGISMIFGVDVPLLGSGFLNGLWLAFIGWFLHNASVQSYRQVVIQDLLEGVSVSRMMRPDPPTVPPECTVSDLIYGHVMNSDDHAFPVTEAGRLVGLVTLDDVRKIGRDQWEATRVRQIMTPYEQLVTTGPSADASEALNLLSQRDIRQLPVLEQGQLVGLLRQRDVVKWLHLQAGWEGRR